MLLMILANGVFDGVAPGALLQTGTVFLPGRARPEFSGAAPGTLWALSTSLVAGQPAADASAPGRVLSVAASFAPGGTAAGCTAPGRLLQVSIALVPGAAEHRPPKAPAGGVRASATVSVPRVVTSPATGRQVV